MKKLCLLLVIFLLMIGMCACGQTPEQEAAAFVFPEGSTLMGVNLTGMSQEAAAAAVQQAAAQYTLTLTVDGVEQTVSGAEIGVGCDPQRLNACISAMAQGTAPDPTGLILFNEGKLRALADRYFNHNAVEASLTFDETAGAFVLIPHANGQKSNPNAIVAAVADTIRKLEGQAVLTDVSQILEPVRSAEDPEVIGALEKANKMLSTQLTYTFTPDSTTSTHVIPAEVIRTLVCVDNDGITPVIHQENLEAYVTELSEKYSIAGTSGNFKTTGGGTVGLTVSYNGSYVDNSALAEDMAAAIEEGLNETRTAPYLASGNREMAYGGTYIEVNLSSQHLWFYKNGTCIVSTSLVSGKVAEGMCTPTGVFSIYQRKAGAYLEGDDYRTYVNFWMPFYYGYGLHDATWRGSFGGSIYLYSGSHGCVNLPYSAASSIFNNVTVGTKVILYGGERSVPPVSQKLTGTTSYNVADDASSFKLNIKPKYTGKDLKLTYASDNSKVASVSADGTVTVNGIGTANITVTASKFSYYTEATTTVTVKVHSACDDGRHVWGTPTQVKAPSCQPGLEKVTCTKCKTSTEREIPATESHSYGDWVTTKEPTCGTEGTKERTCTKCSVQKETGTIPATGNHTEGDWNITKAPTCVAEGKREIKCSVCGTVTRSEAIPADPNAHTPGDWVTTKEPTCTEPGTKEKACKDCKKVLETASIPAAHTPGDWETVEAPTCTKEGRKVKKCTVCSSQLEEAAIGKKSHEYNGGPACIHCGAPNPNYTEPTPTGDDEDEDE